MHALPKIFKSFFYSNPQTYFNNTLVKATKKGTRFRVVSGYRDKSSGLCSGYPSAQNISLSSDLADDGWSLESENGNSVLSFQIQIMVNSNELYEFPRPTLAKIVNIGGLGVEFKDAKPLSGVSLPAKEFLV